MSMDALPRCSQRHGNLVPHFGALECLSRDPKTGIVTRHPPLLAVGPLMIISRPGTEPARRFCASWFEYYRRSGTVSIECAFIRTFLGQGSRSDKTIIGRCVICSYIEWKRPCTGFVYAYPGMPCRIGLLDASLLILMYSTRLSPRDVAISGQRHIVPRRHRSCPGVVPGKARVESLFGPCETLPILADLVDS